jgi:hypothetical protein
MLIKQLRRNSILLTHSSQRFNLLLELFQSYEQFYQEQLGLNRLNSSLDASNYSTYATINFNTYYSNLHDSYQTIKDRIKKIYLKMDIISSCTEAATICEKNNNNNNDASFNNNTMSLTQSNHIDLIKLFEYQIIEMQHEYELLLEDKVS